MLQSIKNWFKSLWSAVKTRIGVKATPVASVPPASPVASPDKPQSTVTIPNTDRQINKVTAAYLGVSEETSKTLDGRIGQGGGGDGWTSGYTLDAFGVGRSNVYQSNKTETYTITVPVNGNTGRGFEFVWSEATNSIGAMVSATVSGPAGTFSAIANQHLGSVPVPGAKAGETYTASIVYTVGQEGHAQINPL